MIGPLRVPDHRRRLPINRPPGSDRNFYDACYFNGMDPGGDTMLITGLGYYPNLGVKDAYCCCVAPDPDGGATSPTRSTRTGWTKRVGRYALEVIEPLQKIRLVLEETEGLGMDITWEGSHPVVQELPHLMLASDTRPTLDAQRFAPAGHLVGPPARRWRGDHRRPRALDGQPGPVLGNPTGGRGRAGRPPGRIRRWKASGGSTSRCASNRSRW